MMLLSGKAVHRNRCPPQVATHVCDDHPGLSSVMVILSAGQPIRLELCSCRVAHPTAARTTLHQIFPMVSRTKLSHPMVVEIKTTLAGVEKRFDCRWLAGDARQAVVLWVAPAPMHVHGID